MMEDEESITDLKNVMNKKIDEHAKESKALNKLHHRACIGVNEDLKLFYLAIRQGAIMALKWQGIKPDERGNFNNSLIEATASDLIKAARSNMSPLELQTLMSLDTWVDDKGNEQLKITDAIIENEAEKAREENAVEQPVKKGPGRPKKTAKETFATK